MNGYEGMCMSGGKFLKLWQVTDKIIEWIFIQFILKPSTTFKVSNHEFEFWPTPPHPYMTHPTPSWPTPPHPTPSWPTPPHPTPSWCTHPTPPPPLHDPPHPFMAHPHPTPPHPTPPLHDAPTPPHSTPSWPTPPHPFMNHPPHPTPPHPWYIFGHKGAFFHGLLHYVSLSVDKNYLIQHYYYNGNVELV